MPEYDPSQDEIIVTEMAIDFKRLSANPEIAAEESPEVLLDMAAIGALYFSGGTINSDRVRALANMTRTVLPEFSEVVVDEGEK